MPHSHDHTTAGTVAGPAARFALTAGAGAGAGDAPLHATAAQSTRAGTGEAPVHATGTESTGAGARDAPLRAATGATATRTSIAAQSRGQRRP